MALFYYTLARLHINKVTLANSNFRLDSGVSNMKLAGAKVTTKHCAIILARLDFALRAAHDIDIIELLQN